MPRRRAGVSPSATPPPPGRRTPYSWPAAARCYTCHHVLHMKKIQKQTHRIAGAHKPGWQNRPPSRRPA
eukprot:scaffold8659_cov129-Isochrysis_galbana.AAC.7